MITPLKLARQRRGWTQEEVADRLGINHSHLSRMENGNSKPSAPMTRKIAAIFTELTRDQILFPEEYVAADPPAAIPIQATGAA